MAGFRFTDSAEKDLEKIVDYTLENWGQVQARKYIDGLVNLADSLAKNPDIGVNRDNLFEGFISFPYESHVLYYVKDSEGIIIMRVLHEHMDAKKHLAFTEH